MGEEGKLFIGKGVKIMVGDKPIGIVKEGMMTYSIDDDGMTNDDGSWARPIRHHYEITGEGSLQDVGGSTRDLLTDKPWRVDVEMRTSPGKMPRKMKKAYRIGSRYRRNTKWKRKAEAYKRRRVNLYRLPDAEMVVTRDMYRRLETTIKGSILQCNPRAVAHVSEKDIANSMAAYVHKW